MATRDALLFFQRHTVQMMYRVIGRALAEAKSDLHPRDYLNFFCLATVEPGNKKHRKSFIYVHAKVSVPHWQRTLMQTCTLNLAGRPPRSARVER